MNQIQKKQLYKEFLLYTFLIIPLIGLYTYSYHYNTSFFIYIAFGFILFISYLLRLHRKIVNKEAVLSLKIQDCQEEINMVKVSMRHDEISTKSFQDKILNFLQLKGLTEKLGMCLYLDDTSKILSSEVNRIFGEGDRTIILYLLHSSTGDLGISSSRKGQIRINIKSKKGDIFDQWVVKTMQPLLVEDTKSDYRFDFDKIVLDDSRSIRSLIVVPLALGNRALGILRVDSPKKDNFGTEDLRLLSTIGDLGTVAIENAQLYERVEQLAIKDGLTNLYLKRYLLERMSEEIIRHMRGKSPMSFLMIDLDQFKQYNDKFGHVAGDIVLKTISKILSEFFNESGNLVSRYGGEEFSVLLPDCTKKQAIQLAEGVKNKISSQTIILRRKKTQITVSIGVATFPDDAQVKDELIFNADQALYRAKNQGRNRVCYD